MTTLSLVPGLLNGFTDPVPEALVRRHQQSVSRIAALLRDLGEFGPAAALDEVVVFLGALQEPAAAPRCGGPSPWSRLTPQELRVCEEVGRGSSNQEVARALFISHRTVEAHLTTSYRKLGLRSRSQLVRATTLGSLGGHRPEDALVAAGERG